MTISVPTYLLNESVVRANISRMAEKATASGVVFRPHFKTHQSPEIAGWFHEAGVACITVSSLKMADFFSHRGWRDILVAFPVNLLENELINSLANRIHLSLLVESEKVVNSLSSILSAPVDLYIKIDTGYHRTGMDPDDYSAVDHLVHQIAISRNLRLKGLLTHAGHTYHARSREEVIKIFYHTSKILTRLQKRLEPVSGLLVRSVGDTPSCSLVPEFSHVDEVRPGNFVFYDLMQLKLGTCNFSQIAGVVACPVVACHPKRNQAVIYGGAVHLSKEYLTENGRQVYGQMVRLTESGWSEPVPEAFVVSLAQEHGVIEAPGKVISSLQPGEIVGIVPVHSCLTANLLYGYKTLDGHNLTHLNES